MLEKSKWQPQAVAILICKGIPVWHPLIRWWGRWRKIQSPISAKELLNDGWQPGPDLGKELQRLRQEEIDRFQ